MERVSYDQLKETQQAPKTIGMVAISTVIAKEKPYDFDWREAALCAEGDPEEFFPGRGASVKRLKERCGLCKVHDQCLEAALVIDSDKDHGVWGGTTERERRQLRKERRVQGYSGRPAQTTE